MVGVAIPYAYNGYEIIADFSIPHRYLDTAIKTVETGNIPLEYLVTRPGEKHPRTAGRPS